MQCVLLGVGLICSKGRASRLRQRGRAAELRLAVGAVGDVAVVDAKITSEDVEEDEDFLAALNVIKESTFCSLYCIDLFSPCRSILQEEESCGLQCEVDPAFSVPEWLRQRDRDEFAYELDGWSRWEPPADAADYYDLRMYPERHTEYDGSAVWNFVHELTSEAAAGSLDAELGNTLEGLHASISAHIVEDMEKTAAEGVAGAEFARRLANRPNSLKALRRGRKLLLGAVQAVSAQLLAYDYGEETETLHAALESICRKPEAASVGQAVGSLSLCRLRTRELCSVMDCVQCNTCRIHGKVSALGIAVAFQALHGGASAGLRRIEVAALLLALQKFSSALRFVDYMAKK